MLSSLLLSLCLVSCGGGGGGAAPVPAAGSGSPAAAAPAEPAAEAPRGNELRFSFSLAAARTTSAGVYDAEGRLVRTLWRGERLAAGSHARSWDQRRDDGSAAAGGPFTLRLIHHDISYRWDGVVGNSSAAAATASGTPHRAYLPPQTLVIDGRQLHFGSGYNEAQSSVHGFDVGDPQRPSSRVSHRDPFTGVALLASDGQRLYAANTGGMSVAGFVFAYQLADGRPASFGRGQPLCLNLQADGRRCWPDQTYASVVAQRAAGEPLPSGLAVQKNGSVLAVAYGSENRVRLFDKVSGELLNEISVALSPHSRNHLAMAPGGDLWVIGESALLRYTDLARQPRQLRSISGLERPLAAAVDPADDNKVWVAEGGAAQQLRRFAADGRETAVLGRRGGMAGQATVAADRLCFADQPGREHTALAIDGEGRPWVIDSCNNRLLQLGLGGELLAQLAYLPHVYIATVDAARPERVFANFMEFEVDASRELSAAGAWRLVRNWLPALPAALRDEHARNTAFGGFRQVQTLPNGRSYAMLEIDKRQIVVELAADATVREVARLRPPAEGQTAYVLHEGGDLGYAADDGGQQVVYRQRLEGFDNAGNPRWASTPTRLASAPVASTAPVHRMGVFTGATPPRFPLTSGGKVVFFDAAVEGPERFHLGAVAQGERAFAWMASRSGPLDGRGNFQTRTSDSRIQYGGNVAMASGRNVLYGYHGEFYTDLGNGRTGQANQFMHFLDNGLFIGQFGVPSTRDGPAVAPGRSGNAFSPTLVRAGRQLLLYHNDESTWGGLHRWTLQGADEVVELSASGELGSSLSLR